MMKSSYCILLCAIIFCGSCFADSFTVNTAVYDVYGAASVAVDINNVPVMVCENDYIDLLLINQTSFGYEANSIPQTLDAEMPQLAVTSNNELALCFRGSGGVLWYGSKGSWFDWTFSQVESSTVTACDLALTSSDIPHIAYGRAQSIYRVFYDVRSGQWIKEHLTGFGTLTSYKVDIAVSGDDKVMVLCAEGPNLFTAVCQDGLWRYLPAIDVSALIRSLDCSFTADNLPAVAYINGNQLVYAVYVNDIIGWVETVITDTVGSHPSYSVSLAHSSTGTPGIAYIDDYKLMYATNVTALWTTTEIDERGVYPDLIFDHEDRPLIAYRSEDTCLNSMPVIKLAGIGLEGFNITDINNDKSVNFEDFAVMAEYWMDILPQPDISVGDFNLDSNVDPVDLKWLTCNWLWQG
ncbi:MAG: hypothetical protein JW806_01365 [Sedimentisphaerales bacterium]|nr:hypothetical protein [Sedimentisphaerales bacterium]